MKMTSSYFAISPVSPDERLLYQQKPLPQLEVFPKSNPPPACASIAKREMLDFRIEFSRVTTISG